MTGDDVSLLPMLARAMVGGTALVPGVGDIFTATDNDGRIIGFVVATMPGQPLFTTEASRSHGYYTYASNPKLDPRACELFKDSFAKVPLETNLPAKELEITSYWVHLAMVRAGHQGQGVGSALFRAAFARARELAAPRVALNATSERNVAIYSAIGLELVKEARFETPFNEVRVWYLAKKITEP